MTETSRQRLLDLFKQRAFSFGKFTLASGKESSYYINSKKALFHSEAVSLLGEAIYDLLHDLDIQAVGGLEVGAIPLATAVVMHYHRQGREMEGFFVRKQAKGHGSQERIEGVLPAGARVAIVDDVLTTGGSALQAVQEVERAGRRCWRSCASWIAWRERARSSRAYLSANLHHSRFRGRAAGRVRRAAGKRIPRPRRSPTLRVGFCRRTRLGESGYDFLRRPPKKVRNDKCSGRISQPSSRASPGEAVSARFFLVPGPPPRVH